MSAPIILKDRRRKSAQDEQTIYTDGLALDDVVIGLCNEFGPAPDIDALGLTGNEEWDRYLGILGRLQKAAREGKSDESLKVLDELALAQWETLQREIDGRTAGVKDIASFMQDMVTGGAAVTPNFVFPGLVVNYIINDRLPAKQEAVEESARYKGYADGLLGVVESLKAKAEELAKTNGADAVKRLNKTAAGINAVIPLVSRLGADVPGLRRIHYSNINPIKKTFEELIKTLGVMNSNIQDDMHAPEEAKTAFAGVVDEGLWEEYKTFRRSLKVMLCDRISDDDTLSYSDLEGIPEGAVRNIIGKAGEFLSKYLPEGASSQLIMAFWTNNVPLHLYERIDSMGEEQRKLLGFREEIGQENRGYVDNAVRTAEARLKEDYDSQISRLGTDVTSLREEVRMHAENPIHEYSDNVLKRRLGTLERRANNLAKLTETYKVVVRRLGKVENSAEMAGKDLTETRIELGNLRTYAEETRGHIDETVEAAENKLRDESEQNTDGLRGYVDENTADLKTDYDEQLNGLRAEIAELKRQMARPVAEGYDDGELRRGLGQLQERVEELERTEKPAGYDDKKLTAEVDKLKRRVGELEQTEVAIEEEPETKYDDSELRERIVALEKRRAPSAPMSFNKRYVLAVAAAVAIGISGGVACHWNDFRNLFAAEKKIDMTEYIGVGLERALLWDELPDNDEIDAAKKEGRNNMDEAWMRIREADGPYTK